MKTKNKKEKEHSKSIDKFTIVIEELYKVLCETIQKLLQTLSWGKELQSKK